MIFKALEFATKAHTGQYRKGTKIPYIVHPVGVMKSLVEIGCNEDICIAGLLHDTIEDCDIKPETINQLFGQEVRDLVLGASEKRNPEDESHHRASWKERKTHTLQYLVTQSDVGILSVVCADKLDNISDTLRDLTNHGIGLWERFNASPAEQKWYYQSLAKVFLEKQNLQNQGLNNLSLRLNEKVNLVFGLSVKD